jgi:hypothetical protein
LAGFVGAGVAGTLTTGLGGGRKPPVVAGTIGAEDGVGTGAETGGGV